MSDGQQETTLERRVALPEPDVSNITVLTESLPNEPVLPWHHFDSPWLERDGEVADEAAAPLDTEAEPEPDEQLTLELEVLVETVHNLPGDNMPGDDLPQESAA
ncbi:hypothetical protein [Phormidium tenue]|uniref:Uncharacterized protein n=1 Tax=Phormidium tenue NIES-30 TaxID=549789 RepID=A0A1U7J1X1_9CYAN|nr:hypothetical protein [Phormidium tenue]MBD2232161.1 hypothetical protein [Phormidium tenue FACHB-1052]OKH45892.1 hypothetical protein NIES30_18620 [Phormidium tenue NIES-30]